jgi:hypothetical protein
MSVTIQVDLPEPLLKEAQTSGLLKPAEIGDLVADELRRRKAAAELEQTLNPQLSTLNRFQIHQRRSLHFGAQPFAIASRQQKCAAKNSSAVAGLKRFGIADPRRPRPLAPAVIPASSSTTHSILPTISDVQVST